MHKADLREKILKALAGSSGQKPVMLDALRKIAEPICDDIQELYDLIEQLYGEKVINRCSGFKEGKNYLAYWLTGSVPAYTPPFSITPQAPRSFIIRPELKVQPKTAEVKPIPSIQQETTMGSSKGITPAIIEIVKAQPGIKVDALHAAVEKEVPGTTLQQVVNLMYTIKDIKREGSGKNAALYPAPPPSACRTNQGQAADREEAHAGKTRSRTGACDRQASHRRIRRGIQLRLRSPQGRRHRHLQRRHLARACTA